jgi:NAD(P)H-dependent FMN reductase
LVSVSAKHTSEPESIREIPLYDGDVEEQCMPAVVQRIKNRIAESDGVLIVTPEHSATPDPTASRTRSYEAAV